RRRWASPKYHQLEEDGQALNIIKSKQRNVILDHVCEEVLAYHIGALEYGVTQQNDNPNVTQDLIVQCTIESIRSEELIN
ncbi:hypothetical protein HDV02_005984, partial [Globomyces sp. JEL0801]